VAYLKGFPSTPDNVTQNLRTITCENPTNLRVTVPDNLVDHFPVNLARIVKILAVLKHRYLE
jgi:hypothetical protein